MARNVVISGGGTGIGLAAAQAFAADGDQVLLLGRRAEVLEQAGVPGALTYAADLTEHARGAGRRRFVAPEFGTVDVLVHSAGGNGHLEPEPDSDEPARRRRARLDRELPAQHPDRGAAHRGPEGPARRPPAGGCCSSAPSPPTGDPAAWRTRRPRPHCIRTPMIWPGSWGRADHRERGRARLCRGHRVLRRRDGRGAPRAARRRRPRPGGPATPGDVAATLHWLASPAAGHITSQIIQVNGGAERGPRAPRVVRRFVSRAAGQPRPSRGPRRPDGAAAPSAGAPCAASWRSGAVLGSCCWAAGRMRRGPRRAGEAGRQGRVRRVDAGQRVRVLVGQPRISCSRTATRTVHMSSASFAVTSARTCMVLGVESVTARLVVAAVPGRALAQDVAELLAHRVHRRRVVQWKKTVPVIWAPPRDQFSNGLA